VPDTVTLPQKNAEGKFEFTGQQDYDKALEAMIANPSSMSDLQALMQPDNVVLRPAETGTQQPAPSYASQTPTATPAAATPPASASPNPSVPQGMVERLRQRAKEQGVEITYQTEDHILDGIIQKEKRIKFLNEQRSTMVARDELERAIKEKKELEDRLRVLQEKPPESQPKPSESQPVVATQSKRPQIDELRKKLRELEDPISDEYIDCQRELNDLMVQELERVEKIRSGSGEKQGANSEVLQMIREVRQELKGMQDKSTAGEKEAEVQRKYGQDMAAIENLQKTHPEFKTSRSMKEMDASYRQWASELYFLRNRRKPETTAEINIVAKEYMDGDAEIQTLAKSAGVEAPGDVKQYLDICNLLVLRDKLSNAVGEDHSLEQVLVYKMARDGTINDAMNQQRQLGAEAIKNGQTKRDTDYAQQLSNVGGQSPEEIGESMTMEQAMKVMNEISPERAARNATDKLLLDKAFAVFKKNMPT
jgi:hypothetical protein